MLCELCGRGMKVLDDRTAICLICYSAQNCPFAFRAYPIIETARTETEWNPRWPISVPWGLMWPHKAQAKSNHGQSLLRLSQRGGLDPVEMLMVIEGRSMFTLPHFSMADAMERIRAYRIHWLRQHRGRRVR